MALLSKLPHFAVDEPFSSINQSWNSTMIFAAAAARDRFGHYHVCRGLRHRIEVWHCPFNSIVTQQKRSIYFFFSSLNPFNLCWVSWGFWPLFLGFKHSIRPHSEQAITVTQAFTFLRTHVIVKLENSRVNNSWHRLFTASYFNKYMCSVYNLGSVCIGPQSCIYNIILRTFCSFPCASWIHESSQWMFLK